MRPSSPIMFTRVESNMLYHNNKENLFSESYILKDGGTMDVFLTNFNHFLLINNITEKIKELNLFFDRDRRVHYLITDFIYRYVCNLSLNEVIYIIDTEMKQTNNFLPLYNIKQLTGGIDCIKNGCYEILEIIFQKKVGLN